LTEMGQVAERWDAGHGALGCLAGLAERFLGA
jgi:hypothetical protein